jgi:protein gp37
VTGIQWTEKTIGCSIVSPGFSPNCSAMKQAAALLDKPDSVAPWYIGTTMRVNRHVAWSGKIHRAADAKFDEPLKWRKPRRIDTPAAIRFTSIEPLLEAVDLHSWLHGLDWLILGGESFERSGRARPFDLAWAPDVLRQCRETRVVLFIKQLGSRLEAIKLRDRKGSDPSEWPLDLWMREWPWEMA